MKTVKEIVKIQPVQHGNKLDQYLKKDLAIYRNDEDKTYELSIYKGKLTKTVIATNIAKLKKSFPALPTDFYEILTDRLIDNKFNDERLTAAINNLIDTCIYPTPTIAQIINYDKRIKLLTYNEVVRNDLMPYYVSVKIYEGQKKPLYASKEDFERYRLEKWKPIKKQ